MGRIDSLAKKSELPTKISDLTNDVGFVTDVPEEIYVGNGEMPDGATVQFIMDGVDEEEALKDEIIGAVLTAIGTPIAGTINENNEILLGGELAEGTYTLKYFNQNDYVQICTLSVDGSGTITPDNPDNPDEPEEIKNWLNYGTTEVGETEIYNGKGWKENTRWSASGNAPASENGCYLAGIIPVSEGDVVYTYDMPFISSLSQSSHYVNYHSDGSITEVNLTTNVANGSLTPDANGVYLFDVPTGVIGVRFSCFGISDTSMITVNQYPIA